MKKLLEVAGVMTLGYIEENIQKGIDYNGQKYKYSENDFYRPFDPKIYNKLKKHPGLADIVQNKKGKLGLIIHGYKQYKQVMNPQAQDDFLTDRGEMLRNMQVLSVSESQAVIGWTEDKQAQKAFWFNVSGVGKSRKLWKFLGITKTQKDKLSKVLGAGYKAVIVSSINETIVQAESLK